MNYRYCCGGFSIIFPLIPNELQETDGSLKAPQEQLLRNVFRASDRG